MAEYCLLYFLIVILFSICCIFWFRLKKYEQYRINNIILQNHLFEMQNRIDMLEMITNKKTYVKFN